MPSPIWDGLIQSTEDMNGTKNLSMPWNKKILPAWLPLNWDIGFSLCSDSNWSIDSSWVLSLLAYTISSHVSQAFKLRLKLNHQLSWVSSLLTHLVDLESFRFPNQIKSNQFLSLSHSVCVCVNLSYQSYFFQRHIINIPYDLEPQSQ